MYIYDYTLILRGKSNIVPAVKTRFDGLPLLLLLSAARARVVCLCFGHGQTLHVLRPRVIAKLDMKDFFEPLIVLYIRMVQAQTA